MSDMLRADEIIKIFRISKQTWWRWWKNGLAPKPAIRSRGYTAWKKRDIEEYINKSQNGETVK